MRLGQSDTPREVCIYRSAVIALQLKTTHTYTTPQTHNITKSAGMWSSGYSSEVIHFAWAENHSGDIVHPGKIPTHSQLLIGGKHWLSSLSCFGVFYKCVFSLILVCVAMFPPWNETLISWPHRSRALQFFFLKSMLFNYCTHTARVCQQAFALPRAKI